MNIENADGPESKTGKQFQSCCGNIAADQITALSNLMYTALDPCMVEGVGAAEDQHNYIRSIAIVFQGYCTSLAGRIDGVSHSNEDDQYSSIAFQITSLGDAAHHSLFHSGLILAGSIDQKRACLKKPADGIKVFCDLIAKQLAVCAEEGSNR